MSKESKESWTSKHRGPDPLKVTHKKNKIGSLVTPRRSKYVKISSEEVSDAVEKYLSGGSPGGIQARCLTHVIDFKRV